MITREQVADLRPGDVVEYAGHPDLRGARLVGPLDRHQRRRRHGDDPRGRAVSARWSYVGPRAPSGRGDASEVTRARTGLHATQETAMTRYEFLGFPVDDRMVERFADNLVLFDNRYGTHVMRMRTTTVPLDRVTRLAARGVAA